MQRTKHFYVCRSLPPSGRNEDSWVLFRETRDHELALYRELKDAVTEAITLARNSTHRGDIAQVHVQREVDGRWLTEWYSPQANPLHF